MLVRAKKSFTGMISMSAGSTADITDEFVLNDLIHAEYVEPVETAEKAVKNESKRTKSKRNS